MMFTSKTAINAGDEIYGSDEFFMRESLKLARIAFENNEVPIGCVIVLAGKIIASASNERITQKNVLYHAEITAINQACKHIGDWRLEDCTLYVTVEPCPMCAGAIVQARIPRVVYGAASPKAGCAGSVLDILRERRFNHQAEVIAGVLENDCAGLMSEFFTRFRKGTVSNMDILKLIDENKLRTWRQHIHMYPEVAFCEVLTSAYIAKELAAYAEIEVLRPTETSVVAVLRGSLPGRVIGLRADIDALPILEETGLPFASKHDGVMHSCGHDAHAAMLLGAVDVLYGLRDKICGTVKFIFQHAEELDPGGAVQIIETGVLDDVECFYGSHIDVSNAAGVVALSSGPIYAFADVFKIDINGKGAHAAVPEKGIDPLLCGVEIITALNHIVSRNISSSEQVVLTTACFHAGTAHNIIPDTAHIKGTVRTYKPELREAVIKKISQITDGICAAHGTSAVVDYTRGYDVVENDEELYEHVKNVAATYLPGVEIKPLEPKMGGEDFSAYKRIAPAFFANVGAKPTDRESFGNHHPKFDIDEACLPIGTAMYAGFVLLFSK